MHSFCILVREGSSSRPSTEFSYGYMSTDTGSTTVGNRNQCSADTTPTHKSLSQYKKIDVLSCSRIKMTYAMSLRCQPSLTTLHGIRTVTYKMSICVCQRVQSRNIHSQQAAQLGMVDCRKASKSRESCSFSLSTLSAGDASFPGALVFC